MSHPTQIASLHASKLERAATDRVERPASDAVDAVVENDRIGRTVG